jgi:hypothetical protein
LETGDAAIPPLSVRFRSWFLEGLSTRTDQLPGPDTQPTERHQHRQPRNADGCSRSARPGAVELDREAVEDLPER